VHSIAQTASGWTDNAVGLAYLRDSLIPQMRAKTPDVTVPILLTYDGHESHDTSEWVQLGIDFNVRLFKLPAKTSNKTQPLDVCGFGPVKKRWLERAEEIVQETGAKVRREDFVHEFLLARATALTLGVVKKGFRDSGICPFNPAIFSDKDYASAQAHSIRSHLPSSFPVPASVLTASMSTRSGDTAGAAQSSLRLRGYDGMVVNDVDDEDWGTDSEAESSDQQESDDEDSENEDENGLFGDEEALEDEDDDDNDEYQPLPEVSVQHDIRSPDR
jgi:hypothetical protein